MSAGHEMVAFLASKSLGIAGETLFLNDLPDGAADEVGVVIETGGSPGDYGFSTPGLKYEYPTLMIRFRGKPGKVNAPRVKAHNAYRQVATIQATTISGTKWLLARSLQPPFIYERDGKDRVVWAFNVLAEKELSATV